MKKYPAGKVKFHEILTLTIAAASFSSNSAAIECRGLGLQHY
jgi:hypothetical protein